MVVDVFFGRVNDPPGWIAPDPSPRARKVTGEIFGSRRGNKLHKYTFSKPELIGPSGEVRSVQWLIIIPPDGDTPSSTDPDLIGEIMVQLSFTANSEPIRRDSNQHALNLGPTKVNEKDKKLGVHCAGPA